MFRAETADLAFTEDLFSSHIPRWCETIDRFGLQAKPRLEILEIGSYEGRSTNFLLRTLPNATVTCVDAWDADAYTRRRREVAEAHIAAVEKRFDANTRHFHDRVYKVKKTSLAFFAEKLGQSRFDLIYVDGSHYCDDVLCDALHSFDMVRAGGIVIFDDYLWRQYRRPSDNPAAAINCLLQIKRGTYRLIHVGWQIILQKNCGAEVSPVYNP